MSLTQKSSWKMAWNSERYVHNKPFFTLSIKSSILTRILSWKALKLNRKRWRYRCNSPHWARRSNTILAITMCVWSSEMSRSKYVNTAIRICFFAECTPCRNQLFGIWERLRFWSPQRCRLRLRDCMQNHFCMRVIRLSKHFRRSDTWCVHKNVVHLWSYRCYSLELCWYVYIEKF